MSELRRQSEENSIPAQERGIDERIVNNPSHPLFGVPIAKTFTVLRRSMRGLKGTPEFEEMLRMARAGEFKYVLVDKMDRAGRNYLETLNVQAEFETLGIKFISAKETFDDAEPGGWLMNHILRLVAAFSSRNLATEAMKGIREKLERGEFPFNPPLGLRFRQPTRIRKRTVNILEADEPHATHIRQAFSEMATGRYTLDEWANLAEQRGIRSRQGRRISASAWGRYFHITVYRGVMLHPSLPDQSFPVHEDSPVLVDAETFLRVQRVLTERANSTDRVRQRAYPLSPVLYSQESNSRCRASTAKKSGGYERAYYYTTDPSGRRTHWPLERVHKNFEQLLDHLTLDPASVTTLRAQLRKAIRTERELRKDVQPTLDKQLARLREARRNLVRMRAYDDITDEDFRHEKQLNDSAIFELEEHIERLKGPLEKRMSDLEAALDLMGSLGSLWREMTDDAERRRFVTLMFKRVTVSRTGRIVGHQLHLPFSEFYHLDSDSATRLAGGWKWPLTSDGPSASAAKAT